jgi:hypothetical protein
VAAPVLSLESQLHQAVLEVRLARHHSTCCCGNYQRHWCTPAEKVACISVDNILDQIRRNSGSF